MAAILMVGAFLTSITGAGAAVAAASALAEGTAQGLAIAALDPPEPDSAFADAETLSEASVPKLLAENDELQPLTDLLQTAATLTNEQGVLSRTHGRLLGALVASGGKGAKLQARQYEETVSQMASLAATLADRAKAAEDVAAGIVERHGSAKIASTFADWRTSGLPAEAGRAAQREAVEVSDRQL